MAEHYTKSTVQASAFCRKCGKFTSHDVHSGRLQACRDCIQRQVKLLGEITPPPPDTQGVFLFPEEHLYKDTMK